MMSFLTRLSADAANSCQDVYSTMILGDDAGKSARLTLVLRPRTIVSLNKKQSMLDLGMTFIEINGRAYVKTVFPGSAAETAGVLPQDAVQYATLFRKEWVYRNQRCHRRRFDDDDDYDDDGDDGIQEPISQDAADSLATKYALDLESKGLRVSYDELRRLLVEGLDPTQSAFLSPPTASKTNNTAWNGPPIPSTVNVCVPMERTAQDGYLGLHPPNGDSSVAEGPASAFSNSAPRPVVFVLRRTRQRKSLIPHSSSLLPTFRLDDECDFATSLVQRLAPTADMEAPPPDSWDELLHDSTDWLLGRKSIFPPHDRQQQQQQHQAAQLEDMTSIPLDDFERERAYKLAELRSRMAAESMQLVRSEDVEAATIRGMIQRAVGLAFVRASKVVMGVSFHAGSGIVIARLSDGTWSAPSAIGTWGLGFGLQFGLEVAEYIFILQTQEALEHFQRGGNFTVGGNIGIAAAGLGREAYGAASVSGVCGSLATVKDDEYNDNDSREENNNPQSLAIAPIVAYAKSQGLYVGVSLEGSRIFARDDINSRTYKFETGRDVTAFDILSGKVATPTEAEELYAALHSVEFTHEMSCLPRPPEILRADSANPWHFDRCTLARNQDHGSSRKDPFRFLTSMTKAEMKDCENFETQFKSFLYGGVSVQRLLPGREGRSGRTARERRTLWLMLPEVGSLRLGFVSKLSDGEGAISNKSSTQMARRDDRSRLSGLDGDLNTVGSEEVTLDSAINTKDGSTIGPIRSGNVQLSNKHSVALTDVSVLSQVPLVPVRFKDGMEQLRIISIQDVSGTQLLFVANNFREAELLLCGLKLLLERETARLGVRGGLPLTAFGGRYLEGAMSPSAARGFRDVANSTPQTQRRTASDFTSDVDDGEDGVSEILDGNGLDAHGSRKWGSVPGRNYMRGQAAALVEDEGHVLNEQGVPQYAHGQQIVRDVAKNVRLPLPLPLCRVLLLDSTSPVIKAWERNRGDKNFQKTHWAFPPATPRELERHTSEHQLIASGSMCDAHRTTSYDRPRYGTLVRLSETHTVDADDSRKITFSVTERNPRRGFSIKVRIVLRAFKESSCDASVVAEVRPIGKNMSNQAAVHRAFLLVMDEIKARYGAEGHGLLAGFLRVVDDMADNGGYSGNSSRKPSPGLPRNDLSRPFRRTDPCEEKKADSGTLIPSQHIKPNNLAATSGLVSLEDMLKTGRESPEPMRIARPSTPSIDLQMPEPDPSKRSSARNAPSLLENDTFPDDDDDLPMTKMSDEPRRIEIKPLPKIRLSLMPSPREEDEDEESSSSPVPSKPVRKKKSSSRSSKRRSSRSKTKSSVRY